MNMDRPLPKQHQTRRLQGRVVVTVAAITTVVMGVFGLRNWLTPNLDITRLRTTIVESGSLHATISANGTVIPEQERALTSPYDTTVLAIVAQVGEVVEPGDVLVELDATSFAAKHERILEQIELTENSRRTKKLVLQKQMIELRGQLAMKRVESELQDAKLKRYQKLQDSGLVSEDIFAEVALAARKAAIELDQLESKITNHEETQKTDLHAIDIELNLLKRDLAEQSRMVDLAHITADRAGMVTTLIQTEGQALAKGAPVATIAELDRYRVRATLSDVYSSRLQAGQLATIEVLDRHVPAHLETVHPTITNGTVELTLVLEEPESPDLKPNLRVAAHIITGSSNQTLRVAKSPFITGPGQWEVFVVEGDSATKRSIQVGLMSFEHMEIIAGLSVGEEIIISDMTRYEHMDEVLIR